MASIFCIIISDLVSRSVYFHTLISLIIRIRICYTIPRCLYSCPVLAKTTAILCASGILPLFEVDFTVNELVFLRLPDPPAPNLPDPTLEPDLKDEEPEEALKLLFKPAPELPTIPAPIPAPKPALEPVPIPAPVLNPDDMPVNLPELVKLDDCVPDVNPVFPKPPAPAPNLFDVETTGTVGTFNSPLVTPAGIP